MINTRVMTGFMELTPAQQIEFDRIKRTIEEEYEKFGFTQIDTPVIERSETLLAKAGGETEKQIYRFMKGDSDISLRFDLTIPLARYVVEHYNDLTFPFRRSHIGKVYRGERPQKGRYREFYQCDIDIVGDENLSIAYDAEISRIIYSIFSRLNFGKFTIKVNNRMILTGLVEHIGAKSAATDILRIIDKVDKISREAFVLELNKVGLDNNQIDHIVRFIQIKGEPNYIISELRSMGINDATFIRGVDDLGAVVKLMIAMGLPEDYVTVDLSIARGLDYYTGTIYETTLDGYPKLGSICSGGRYDNLASFYTNRNLPGVGISIGLTRLYSQLADLGIVGNVKKTIADVIVIPLTDNEMYIASDIANKLRLSGLRVDVLLQPGSVKKKFKYADKLSVPKVVVIGPDEAVAGSVTLQDMVTGEKSQLSLEDVIAKIAN